MTEEADESAALSGLVGFLTAAGNGRVVVRILFSEKKIRGRRGEDRG